MAPRSGLAALTLAATLWSPFVLPGCTTNWSPDDQRPVLSDTIIGGDPSDDATPPAGGDLIDPAGVDDTPSLSFQAGPTFCCSPLAIEFDAELSHRNLVGGARFTWDFGDRRTAAGQSVQHTYNWPGNYIVKVTAALSEGTELVQRRALNLVIDGQGTGGVNLTAVEDPSNGDVPPAGSGDGTEEFVVDAGPDQFVESGELVTLRAGMTGQIGDHIIYTWSQIFGPLVTLSGATTSSPTFVAPSAPGAVETLTFRVTATDGRHVAIADVRVIVSPSPGQAAIPDDPVGGDPPLPPPPAPTSNQPPIAHDHTVAVMQGDSVDLSLTGNDPEGADLTFSVVTFPVHGRLGPIDNTARASAIGVYTPDADFSGTDSILYAASDGSSISPAARITINVTPIGAALVVNDQTYLVSMDTQTGLVLRGGADVGVNLTFTVSTAPLHGTLSAVDNADLHTAEVDYTPDSGYDGLDSFTVIASNGVTASAPATVTLNVHKRIVPWLEVNDPLADASLYYTSAQGALPGMTVLDYCLAGLSHWASITDTVIISTAPGQIDRLYPALLQRKPPGMRVIGGIKTYTLPGGAPSDTRPYDFADAAGWSFIASEVQQIALRTNETVVALENETALRPFATGVERIDFPKLSTSLAPLAATGVQTWWWLPIVLTDSPEFPDRQAHSVDFVAAVAQAVPNSTFMTTYTGWAGWRVNPSVLDNQRRMIAVVGAARMQEGLFVTMEGFVHYPGFDKPCYTPADALVEMGRTGGALTRLYPGSSEWILVAREFESLLPPLGRSRR